MWSLSDIGVKLDLDGGGRAAPALSYLRFAFVYVNPSTSNAHLTLDFPSVNITLAAQSTRAGFVTLQKAFLSLLFELAKEHTLFTWLDWTANHGHDYNNAHASQSHCSLHLQSSCMLRADEHAYPLPELPLLLTIYADLHAMPCSVSTIMHPHPHGSRLWHRLLMHHLRPSAEHQLHLLLPSRYRSSYQRTQATSQHCHHHH